MWRSEPVGPRLPRLCVFNHLALQASKRTKKPCQGHVGKSSEHWGVCGTCKGHRNRCGMGSISVASGETQQESHRRTPRGGPAQRLEQPPEGWGVSAPLVASRSYPSQQPLGNLSAVLTFAKIHPPKDRLASALGYWEVITKPQIPGLVRMFLSTWGLGPYQMVSCDRWGLWATWHQLHLQRGWRQLSHEGHQPGPHDTPQGRSFPSSDALCALTHTAAVRRGGGLTPSATPGEDGWELCVWALLDSVPGTPTIWTWTCILSLQSP